MSTAPLRPPVVEEYMTVEPPWAGRFARGL